MWGVTPQQLFGNNYDTIEWPRCDEIDVQEMGHADGITTLDQGEEKMYEDRG